MDSANLSVFEQNATGAVNSAPDTLNPVYEQNMKPDGVSESGQSVKPYTFRKLKSGDLFPMVKIISKIGLNELSAAFDKNALKALIDQARKENNTDQGEALDFMVGFDVVIKIVNKILEHLPDCQREIYTLLANTSNLDYAELEELELSVFIEMVFDFVKSDGFKDFFKAASKCLQVLG